jgi:hypothetical protein
MDISPL